VNESMFFEGKLVLHSHKPQRPLIHGERFTRTHEEWNPYQNLWKKKPTSSVILTMDL